MRQRLRAVMLIVTALGLALGLATSSTHDRPVAATKLDVLCVAAVEAVTSGAASVATDVAATIEAAPDLVALFVVLAFAAAVGVVCFLLVAGRLLLPLWAERIRSAASRAAVAHARTHIRVVVPALEQLSVLRI